MNKIKKMYEYIKYIKRKILSILRDMHLFLMKNIYSMEIYYILYILIIVKY